MLHESAQVNQYPAQSEQWAQGESARKQVRAVGIAPVIARRGAGHGSGLGVHRWVVEQSFALLHRTP